MSPLIKAIELISAGSRAGFAKAINEEMCLAGSGAISPQQVWNWVNRGDTIPPQYCPAIEKLSKNKVSRLELRPIDWQQIWPELAEKEDV